MTVVKTVGRNGGLSETESFRGKTGKESLMEKEPDMRDDRWGRGCRKGYRGKRENSRK